MIPAVEVRGLSFAYDGRPALRGLSLSIAPGESVGLAGANGSGKSTLLWCLLGLLRAGGEIRLFGERPGRNARRRIGAVFQNPEDQLFLPTILDDIALGLLNRGTDEAAARQKALEALGSVGLSDHAGRSASQLSLGQRKRAAIALALAAAPDLLLLDEPTAELDGRSVRQLAGLLKNLPVARLIASHHLEFLRSVTDRVYVLDDGVIVADGPASAVLSDNGLLERVGLI